MQPPFASPSQRPARATVSEALPSIDEFIDELPPIESFLASTAVDSSPEQGETPGHDWFNRDQYDADGWAVAGWQDFDWSAAASLGADSDHAEAQSAWDTLDWSGTPLNDRASGDRWSTADEVANALDAIARRIRSGDLMIDQLNGTPPEAAMAAALAALLRRRD